MKFWNYIGEFFLFRWMWNLFNHDHHGSHHHGSNHSHWLAGYSDDDLLGDYTPEYYEDIEEGSAYRGQSFDDFMEEQDDWDMMDDGI